MAAFDEDAIRKYFQNMELDQVNRQSSQLGSQGMAEASAPAPPNPYANSGGQKKGGFLGTVGKIAAPIMKLGGMALSAAGMPYVGVPLSIAGSAVGGAGDGGGITGALKGAVTSGVSQGATAGLGAGLDMLKTPMNDPINLASKGLTIPGKRLNPIDMGNMTIPASPKSFGGGMS
ncbi:MAG: hypothetical protein WC749_02125 [Dehalococcoidia bacterium]